MAGGSGVIAAVHRAGAPRKTSTECHSGARWLAIRATVSLRVLPPRVRARVCETATLGYVVELPELSVSVAQAKAKLTELQASPTAAARVDR